MSNEASGTGRGRWQVPALALAFFGPVLLAWVMVATGWYPDSTTNKGQLVASPERVDPAGWRWPDGEAFDAGWFKGRWTVLTVHAGDCGQDCRDLLDKLGRARLALDKDRTRVDILMAQPPGKAGPPDSVSNHLRVPGERVDELIAAAPGEPVGRAVHIVDTDGNRMLTYAMPLNAEHIVEDLEQLLEHSDPDAERLQRLRQEEG